MKYPINPVVTISILVGFNSKLNFFFPRAEERRSLAQNLQPKTVKLQETVNFLSQKLHLKNKFSLSLFSDRFFDAFIYFLKSCHHNKKSHPFKITLRAFNFKDERSYSLYVLQIRTTTGHNTNIDLFSFLCFNHFHGIIPVPWLFQS